MQGITAAERQDFFHLPEGSELYPLAWVKAMHDSATNKPFLKNIERFGMLPDPNDPDGLPIGVSRGKSRGLDFLGDMIGVNCAACHVGQLEHKGKTLPLIGGPSMISMDRFYGDLFGSAGAMVKNPTELAAFYERLASQSGAPMEKQTRALLGLLSKTGSALQPVNETLKAKFQSLFAKVHQDAHNDLDTIKATAGDARAKLRSKFGEVYKPQIDDLLNSIKSPEVAAAVKDAVPDPLKLREGIEDLITNAALMKGRLDFLLKIQKLHAGAATIPGPGRSDAFGVISNMVMPGENIKLTGPVSYPYIWSLGPEYETVWFHYDGNTTSLLERNVGQAIGLGAAFDPKTFSSTIVIRDMDRLQQITRKLRPPDWPETLFGSIDKAKADRGAALYKAQCLECHASAFEKDKRVRERYTPYKEVGTDPNRVDNFQINVQKTSASPEGIPYIKALAKAANELTMAAFKDSNVTPAEQKVMEPVEVKWVSEKAYMARPMVAIWATAPYLHNGSVPTMYDLLQPASKRPKYFVVGNREYDPEKLGYVSKTVDDPKTAVSSPLWVFDTTTDGNHNTGHEYGVNLKDDEKADLIEYLKGNYTAGSN